MREQIEGDTPIQVWRSAQKVLDSASTSPVAITGSYFSGGPSDDLLAQL